MRQLLTESLLLAVLGGVAGLVLGCVGVDGARRHRAGERAADRRGAARLRPSSPSSACSASRPACCSAWCRPCTRRAATSRSRSRTRRGATSRPAGRAIQARADRRGSRAGADAAHRRRPAAADVRAPAARPTSDSIRTNVLVGFVNPPGAGGYDTGRSTAPSTTRCSNARGRSPACGGRRSPRSFRSAATATRAS